MGLPPQIYIVKQQNNQVQSPHNCDTSDLFEIYLHCEDIFIENSYNESNIKSI